jgi:hypothetical protein
MGYRRRLDALSHILAMHLGPVRRLAISLLSSTCKVEPRFHEWFLSPALDQHEELTLVSGDLLSLPPSALRLAPMLPRAKFLWFVFPQINVVPALHFPKLKHLELLWVTISKEDLEHLPRDCTALEHLHLQGISGFGSICIASTNIHEIYVERWRRNRDPQVFQDMVIENAPFLERLYVYDKAGPIRIRVFDAPKLTVLAYSCAMFSELFIGSISVQVHSSSSSPSSYCTSHFI